MGLVRLWLLFFIVFVLASCGNSSNQTEKSAASTAQMSASVPSAKKPLKIALVLKTQTNPFFVEMEKGARRAEKVLGIELLVRNSSQETFIEEQIQIVEELIEAKVDALVIAPGDSQRLIPSIKKAQSAGIVIINIDNPLDQKMMQNQQMQPIPFISVDNESASYHVSMLVADKIHKPTQVALLEGLPGAGNAVMRTNGALRAIKQNPMMHLVAEETAHWKIDEAHEVARHIFMMHPKVGALICANDMMALGAIQYLADSGRKNVLVVGYDALDEARAAIKAGTMLATVDQQAAEQGYQGVALAVRALKGEKIPPVLIIDTRVITADTLK
ncbi:substrate-binding domain-containing protein [Solimicrobium silvestre]|uniref:ABC-type sugar transport system periplasmic component n=1 Tax=Solimicrobium silvestre TaxID=2099400 RepID=A0A2S9GU41_9BURK|nr:substrate-binding domain-containing protein [Solimicrobium silvestre]PRC91224.1 ABC-type sugar transport system periplasmic component [Solimicrobium silvestre]